MPHPRSLRPCLPWLLLLGACSPNGEAPGGGQTEPVTGTTSPSTASPDLPPPGPPTTTVPTTGMATTDATSTTTNASSTSDADTGAIASSSSSSTTDSPSPTCGDGHLDPGEACDHGFAENSDQGACTLACQLATCGDGLIWADSEACDNGPNNNDDLYGGCTTKCQAGAQCNDGAIQGPEECDLGADNGSGEFPANGVGCDAGCRYQARLVFLSSTTYKGGDLGGVEGAHLKCQALAKQAKFDNAAKFMAWISDAQHSPFQDFNHSPETASLPYVLPNGVRIADNWDDLILNGPGDGILVTETGEMLLDKRVWTGTAPSGKVFDPSVHCKAWSSSSPADKSRVGRNGVAKQPLDIWTQWDAERQWTNVLTAACDLKYRLYCFEQ